MEQQMMEAARSGDIDALYALINQEPNLLEEMDKISFVETPLHVAASQGQTHFALEMMGLKPSFARKWNQDRFTPIHLAVKRGQTATVIRLLNNNYSDGGHIVRGKGKGGLTPLHCAAEQGNIELLLVFLSVCPKSMEDVTIRNETCLHLALKNNQLEAFKALIGWIELGGAEGAFWEERILNWKDDQGETISDLATSRQELIQVVSLLANSRLARYLNVPAQKTKFPISYLNGYMHLLSTDKRLNKAAYDGDTDSLYEILKEDLHILERIDQVPFVDTPLHIAASEGHIVFTKEIVKLKSSFARKLNQDGFSPLHLAVQNQQTKIAILLLDMNNELLSVKGKNDMTPLHCAAEVGNRELLGFFLETQPQSIKDLTVRDESSLHVAVRHNKLESSKLLCQWIQKHSQRRILRWTDHEGNTARDIAENQRSNLQIRAFLRKIGAPSSKGHTMITFRSVLHRFLLPTLKGFNLFRIFGPKPGTSQKDVNTVLVVYTLIASSIYQAGITPPGGDHFFSTILINKHSGGSNHKPLGLLNYSLRFFLTLNAYVFFFSVFVLVCYIPRKIILARAMLFGWAICYISVMLYNLSLQSKLN